MLVIPKRPWKNYRRIKDNSVYGENVCTCSRIEVAAYVVIGAIVLCGIIIIVAVLK